MAKVFLFNPYTGTPRHPSDIASDPEGLAIVDDTVPLRAAQAATPAPALYVGLIERLMRLSTRLGIAHEGGVEHFAAGLEDRLYAICRGAEGLLDSMAATPAPAEPPTFARRWRIASDGFGLQRDDEDGCYVHYHDAAEVLHRALAATPESHVQRAPAPAPLTDEQIDKTAERVIPVAAYMGMFEYAAFSKEDADRTVRHFARAIEAAHGIGKGKESA